MKNRLCFFILFFILILGFFLRVVNLQNLPHGFFCDEASIGYNAYSLLKTGKDEYGKSWPLFFKAFGEYKGPIQIYSTIPFVAIFGLNEFSVRLTSAIYGTLTILAVYFLVKELFPKKNSQFSILNSQLIASFFLAISPWHIHFSRVGFELMPFVFFSTLGVWLFLKSLKAKNRLLTLNFAFLTFNLAFYSYSPARIFIPLFLTGLVLIFRKSFKIKALFLSFFIFFLLSLPLLFHIKSGQGLSRWHQVSVFKEKTFSQAVKQMEKNYLAHFSLDFLFKKGDAGMSFLTRHSVRGMGELYWFQLPLIILGILGLWRLKKHKELAFLIWWLILYPLGSVLTADATPQATRSIIGVIPFQILSAAGVFYLFNLGEVGPRKMRSNLIRKILALLLLLLTGLSGAEFARYLNLYFNEYPKYSSGYYGWQWGFREIMEDFANEQTDYDELLITHRFNMGGTLLKFYQVSISCQKCKIAFNPITFDPLKKQLFALRKEGVEELEKQGVKFTTKKILYYPDDKEAFFIGEVQNRALTR
ncbi:glycosyltransferase family 39 protein [Candidatus Microgenomates bacterium]|nr:glycosyltransferase family 39 protein [Candidatus Microgenomates bacterium]